MNELIPLSIQTKLPKDWSYDSSIKKVRAKVLTWKSLTSEILEELWIAREMLSKPGNPHRNGTIVPVKTWNEYCQEIGLVKKTVNRWLDRFNPQTLQIKEKEIDENISTNNTCPKCGYSWN